MGTWQREGQIVKARYLGVQVEGLVVESRVKYQSPVPFGRRKSGGRVQHRLTVLDLTSPSGDGRLEPYVFLGETREGGVVLVEEETVEEVLEEFEVVAVENIAIKQD